MLHHHVSTEAQSGQTEHQLIEGFYFCILLTEAEGESCCHLQPAANGTTSCTLDHTISD